MCDPPGMSLRVIRQDGMELWCTPEPIRSHAGWTSVFACKIDGQDYLLQYEPEMCQGWGEYTYRPFHPDIISPASNEPAEQVLRESAVTWDLNFGREGHQSQCRRPGGFPGGSPRLSGPEHSAALHGGRGIPHRRQRGGVPAGHGPLGRILPL